MGSGMVQIALTIRSLMLLISMNVLHPSPLAQMAECMV